MSTIVKEVYDAFISAGVSDDQATAAARAIPLTGQPATKGDINELRAELKEMRAEIKETRTELKGVPPSLRAEFKSDMKELELRMTVKFYTAMGLVIAGIKALDFLIS